MPNNISKPLVFGEHAVCITNTSIHSFGELVDRLQLSLLPFFLTKLSLIIYIRKYLNGLPFWHSAGGAFVIVGKETTKEKPALQIQKAALEPIEIPTGRHASQLKEPEIKKMVENVDVLLRQGS
jgi:hypothetical protein